MLAVHAVVFGFAHPALALRPAEARLTQAAPVNVEAAGAVGAVAHPFAVLTVGSSSALLITPGRKNAARRLGPEPQLCAMPKAGLIQLQGDFEKHLPTHLK